MNRLIALLVAGTCGGAQDVVLPPPKDGFQLATDSFTVPVGQEVQRCYFFRVPGAPGSDPVQAPPQAAS